MPWKSRDPQIFVGELFKSSGLTESSWPSDSAAAEASAEGAAEELAEGLAERAVEGAAGGVAAGAGMPCVQDAERAFWRSPRSREVSA